MRVMVIDIGNSNLKIHIWEGNKLIYNHLTPSSPKFSDNLAFIDNAYKNSRQADAHIILSMSDSVIFERADGVPIRLQHNEPSHSYFTGDLPAYVECGLPRATALNGMLNQVSMVKTLLRAERGFRKNPKRILPPSTYIAAHLAGERDFNNWEITHATNSGFFNHQKANPHDERFPLSGWHQCVDDVIEDGFINEKILLPQDKVGEIMLGGHDTTFASALDTPHATKPYISCGTWITVSRETAVSRKWKDDGTRNVASPGGTILNQLCIPSGHEGKNKALAHIRKTFTKYSAPIKVFGSWANSFLDVFSNQGVGQFLTKKGALDIEQVLPVHGDIEHLPPDLSALEFELMPKNYLSETTARFAVKNLTQ